MSTAPLPNIGASAFGHFSEDGREYILTNLHTPRPWVNVMSYGTYGLVISQSGGGFSWIDNSQMYRLTRWEQDLVAEPFGRWIYVQDRASGDVWSTTLLPTHQEADRDLVRHGIGYTVYERLLKGIETKQTVFVPLESGVEYWMVEVTNHRAEVADLRFATFVDWLLGGNGDWHREFHRLFMETETLPEAQIAWKHTGLRENSRLIDKLPFVAYHAAKGGDSIAWCGDKAEFLGTPGNPAKPAGLEKDELESGTGRWDDPIASALVSLKLQPGETRTIIFALGAEKDRTDAVARASSLNEESVRAALGRVKRHWDDVTEPTHIDTPDPLINTLTNRWLRAQAIMGRMDARSAYYQQGGAYGYRDQLQDSLICLQHNPERTLRQLELHAEAMYENGAVRHWWHPGFPIFAESHHSDTCLWLAYGLLAYLDETNDLGCLQRRVRFLREDNQGFGETGSLLEHVYRGVERALNLVSPRGLPLLQAGDWNDGLSHAGIERKGETVWLAMFLYDILTRWKPILEELGETGRAQQFERAAKDLQNAVEEHGWDGGWYIAGTRDDGIPFGSHENKEGAIFLNPQTWATISGIAGEERAEHALRSAETKLFKPYGALLLAPAYATVDPMIGYITRYAPGLRENGGVYSHAATWAVQALAMRGRPDDALQMLRALIPAKSADEAANYVAEPYVMPGNVDGPDSPREGRGGWTWYTGSAAWLVRVAVDWVCGVRASRQGLVFSAGPSEWSEYRVQRCFRGTRVKIHVTGQGSQVRVLVNGAEVSGPVLPEPGQSELQVHVERY